MNLSPAQRQTLSWLLIATATLVLLWLLAPVLTPFLVAAVLAYALHPAVEALARRGLPAHAGRDSGGVAGRPGRNSHCCCWWCRS